MSRELLHHLPEFRLLFRGGKLWQLEFDKIERDKTETTEDFANRRYGRSEIRSKDGWRNVNEHQVIQLSEAIILGNLLELSNSDRKSLETVALIHECKKRLDRRPEDFTPEERDRFQMFLDRINPDTDLMEATGPAFLEKALAGKATFLELLQFYLDDITKGKKIVPFDERIDEVSARRQDLNENVELTQKLGGRKYWDIEREIGHVAEKLIFGKLIEKGIEINSPEEIPALIRSRIEMQQNG